MHRYKQRASVAAETVGL